MASLPDSSMVGADLTVQPGSNRMSPKAIDWVDGWQANPIPSAAPRHSVGTSLSGRNPKYRGYRDSYLDQSARSKLFVPGPGNHRTSRALALLDSGDNRLGTMNTGRMGDTFSCSMGGHSFGPTIGASNLRATVHGGAHLSDGEDVDGQRTAFPRSPSASMKMSAVNVRSLPSLNNVPRTLLPSSFCSPGPGAYNQYSSFGAPSGPTRKCFLGTNRHDNVGISRPAEKFGGNTVTSKDFRVTRKTMSIGAI
eukprot:TRINITY_DN9806_c0_g1_i2.p1 TRINITY_DN9806_c0_g1~~TRINITY_DN9806_c0_g1_i2.p1  ORF type:complete len:251 (-),score=25.02 TRINITY_DN9806_c0_g1_i2:111-863(-)